MPQWAFGEQEAGSKLFEIDGIADDPLEIRMADFGRHHFGPCAFS
jgi:hypothetical protein